MRIRFERSGKGYKIPNVKSKDILLKDYFTPDVFADAINAILYDGKSVVTPEKMRAIDIETQRVEEKDGDIKADVRFRDLAKVVEVDDAIYCLFAIEHQSVEDYTMPLRIMEYDVREYLRQVKSNNCLLYTSPSPRDS